MHVDRLCNYLLCGLSLPINTLLVSPVGPTTSIWFHQISRSWGKLVVGPNRQAYASICTHTNYFQCTTLLSMPNIHLHGCLIVPAVARVPNKVYMSELAARMVVGRLYLGWLKKKCRSSIRWSTNTPKCLRDVKGFFNLEGFGEVRDSSVR